MEFLPPNIKILKLSQETLCCASRASLVMLATHSMEARIMNYRSLFPRDMYAELDRLQREMQQAFDLSPNIRGLTRGFPAMNVGGTAKSVEIYAFAPGIDPASLDVQIERGVLTVAGERKTDAVPENATVHIDERFAGRFRRVVTLPDDTDSNAVEAKYRDGVLHISIARKEAAQPRRIAVQ
jgi:HSP20 family protein